MGGGVPNNAGGRERSERWGRGMRGREKEGG